MTTKVFIWCCLIAAGFWLGVWAEGQVIEGHETIEYTMKTTYIGPADAIRYDLHFQVETMQLHPEIFCEGDFKFQAIVESEYSFEIICTYDWDAKHDGSH